MAQVAAILHVRRRTERATARRRLLEKCCRQRQLDTQREVSRWFDSYDSNGSGTLEQKELAALLTTLDPSYKPTEASLAFFESQCPGHQVTRENVLVVVKRCVNNGWF